MPKGSISNIDGKWFIDGYPIHKCQSYLLTHDISYKMIKERDVFACLYEYDLEYNPGRGAWLYAVVKGIRDTRNEDASW